MYTKKIGIVGGGQLGRMLTLSAKQMGFYVTIIDPTPNSPAAQVADKHILADFKDENAINELASISDVITFEVELANDKILYEVQQKGTLVNPSPQTLSIIKDKFLQKQFLNKHKIPTADFVDVQTYEDVENAINKFKYPVLLKARIGAYDGRGNFVIRKRVDIEKGFEKLKGKSLYVEKYIPFIKELAVMVARSTQGEIKTYPIVETIHTNSICDITLTPANISEKIKKDADILAKKVMKKLNGAGVFGIEMFLTKNGVIIINEIAPRVHNSGHYTVEASITSQFEQHIRAITGMPLGSTDLIYPACVMKNILGKRTGPAEIKGVDKALKIPFVAVHIYGKMETKIDRKMGHITALGKTVSQALRNAQKARRYISI